jgi:lactate dehydrogenase-like 2-hydroxyacid dehydrogenase
MNPNRPRVVLTRRWPVAVEAVLAEEFDLVVNETDQPFSDQQLADALRTADVLCPTVTDALNAELLGDHQPRVQLIANFGVGFNHIDIAAAARQAIAVTNTPGVLTECTADLTMTLLLMAARRAGEGERELRAGGWSGWRPTHLLGRRVTGKTIGIVGAGRIGLAVARRAHHGFGMQVLLHNRSELPRAVVKDLGAECCDLESLLSQADFVSLHCPSTPETRHLINPSSLSLMQPHAMLINTARGDVVDEAALVAALQSGSIAGVGLDVYEQEPQVSEGLMELPNVVLLPHLGSGSEETRVAMGMCAVDNIRAFQAGTRLPNPVTDTRPDGHLPGQEQGVQP